MTAPKSQVSSHTNAYIKDKASHRLRFGLMTDVKLSKAIAIYVRVNKVKSILTHE